MRFKLRRRPRRHSAGPLRWNTNWFRPTSWGFKWWRWSFNSRTGKHKIDLPGPVDIEI